MLPVFGRSLDKFDVDYSFGRFSQCETALERLGLFADNGESALCGPTSICNLLHKFRRYLGIERKRTHIAEIQYLTENVFPELDIRNQGLQPDTIAELIQKYFSEQSIGSETIVWELPEPDVFQNSLLPHTGVLIQFDWWSKDSFRTENPWWTPHEDGHFVVVVGVQRDNPARLLILDPWEPSKLFELELVKHQSQSGRLYYLVRWIGQESPAQPAHRQAILRAAIEVRVSK